MNGNALTILLVALISAGLGFGFGMASGNEQAAPPPAADFDESSADRGTTNRSRLSSGARSTPGAPAEASTRTVDHSASVREAAQRFAAEPVELRRGQGRIDGTVRTIEGNPLEGVVLVATASAPLEPSFGRSSRGAGNPPPSVSTLDEALNQAAERWQRDREKRFETRTDANGHYLFDQLPETGRRIYVRAYLEDWKLSTLGESRVATGTTLDFIATPVHGLAFDIVLPDGTRPERAAIQVSTGQNRWNTYQWSPEDDRIRFVDRIATVRAYAEPFPVEDTAGNGVAAEFLSEPISLTEEHFGAGVARIELQIQNGIRVRFADPNDGVDLEVVALYRLSETRPDENPNWDSPLQSEWGAADGVAFTGLEPGLYLVGAGERRAEPVLSARVRVDQGFVDAELVGDPDRENDFLTVQCEGPDGGPLLGCGFRTRIKRSQWSTSNNGVRTRQSGLGLYRISFAELSEGDVSYADWPDDASVSLAIIHPTYGEQLIELREGQREATVRFQEPASLTVVITGHSSESATKNPIWIEVVRSDDPDKNGWRGGSDDGTKSPDAQGRVRFTKLSPGLVEVRLLTSRNTFPRRAATKLETELRPGTQEVTMAMPVLHELSVHAPGLKKGEDLYLNQVRSDPNDPWVGPHSAAVDSTGRARFASLVAGKYSLNDQRGGTIEVTIPTGEVLFEPRRNDCIRVTINDRKGSMFRAGLRGGDLIIAIGGVSLTAENLTEQRQKFWENGGLVTVVREEETLQFDLSDLFPAPANNLGGWVMDGMR